MSRAKSLFICLGAVLALAGTPSAVFAAVTCKFQAKGLGMSFGTLNPSAVGPPSKTVALTVSTLNADTWGNCPGVTMSMSAVSANASGGVPRMTNGSAFIPYSLTLPGSATGPGGNGYVQFAISATVLGASYVNAPGGLYSDQVTITVSP